MLHQSDPLRFHLWLPNMFGFKGGIQVYSAFLMQALQAIYPQAQYDVFLKHDVQPSSDIAYLPTTRFHFTGSCLPQLRTMAFAAQLLSHGILSAPDLVIASHLNFTIAAHALNRLTGTPYWAIAHGIEAWGIQNPILQAALHNADRILCVSRYTRDRLLKEQRLDPAKLGLLPNTFDQRRFQLGTKPAYLLERYGLTSDQPILLTVARLCSGDRYKGYDQVLQALPRIRQQIPNVHYVLVGKGDDRPRVAQQVAALELQDCVTIAGFVADAELGDHYNLCDVFAMPSQREGFGIVYIEAIACGKPTVGGNQDGAVDALVGGSLGALVDPHDIEAIAQTLVQILRGAYPNPLLYQPERLRQKVIDTFGFEQFQQTLAAALQHHFSP